MIRNIKKGLACALVAALAFTCAAPVAAQAADSATVAPEPEKKPAVTAPKGESAVANLSATVSTSKAGTAALKGIGTTSKKSITVKSTVKVDGYEYTVTTISANAFKKATKAQKIALPTSIKYVKANAFTGAKKLKTLEIKSKGLVKVNKNAFKGLSKSQKSKIVIKVSKKMSKKNYNALVKYLKKAGISAKNIKKVL